MYWTLINHSHDRDFEVLHPRVDRVAGYVDSDVQTVSERATEARVGTQEGGTEGDLAYPPACLRASGVGAGAYATRTPADRLEFDHNMSQQIYVSEQVWDKIVAARGQMLAFVSAMAMQLPPESTSLDYAKTLLTAYNTNGETANETALHALKEEAAKLI